MGLATADEEECGRNLAIKIASANVETTLCTWYEKLHRNLKSYVCVMNIFFAMWIQCVHSICMCTFRGPILHGDIMYVQQ